MNSRQKEAGKPASAFGIREGSEQQTENRAVSPSWARRSVNIYEPWVIAVGDFRLVLPVNLG
jgi:hypothetical protein